MSARSTRVAPKARRPHSGRSRGISLGDRACLALAGLRRLPVLAGDRAWATLGLPIEVRLLR